MTAKDVIKFAKENKAACVDLKFMDFLGTWQHFTIPMSELNEGLFDEGSGFDGSSIRGWQPINASDMLIVPDPATAVMDPFMQHPTLSLIGDVIDLAITSVFAVEPRDTSLLFLALYTAMAGADFNNLINTTGGAQEKRIVGGSQRISLELAKRLGKAVKLSRPVKSIGTSGGRVAVRAGDDTWSAKRVIVTVPPALIGGIRFNPPLPASKAQLDQRFPMGTVIKCMAVYDSPFWRDDGLNGMTTSDTGPVKLTYDNSPPDGDPGVLLGFIEGQDARELLEASEAERKAAVVECFVRYFGSKAESAMTGYVEKSWAADPWSRGCYGGVMPPGAIVAYPGVVRRPAGRIHWAGTETATEWGGYMDGAIQSGQRAAAEVLAKL